MATTSFYPSEDNSYYGPSSWPPEHQALAVHNAVERENNQPTPGGHLSNFFLQANFTKAQNDRRDAKFGAWVMPNMDLNNFTQPMYNFATPCAPKRRTMISDDQFNPWLDRIQERAQRHHIKIFDVITTMLYSDLRYQYAEQLENIQHFREQLFDVNPEFWVFCSGDAQNRTLVRGSCSMAFRAQDSTKEFTIPFGQGTQRIGGFKGWVRRILIPTYGGGGDLWLQFEDFRSNYIGKRYSLDNQRDMDQMMERIFVSSYGNRIIIGISQDEPVHQLRNNPANIVDTPNSHWWLTIINTVTGGVYVHNSMRGVGGGPKTAALVENLNWHLSHISGADLAASNAARKFGPWAKLLAKPVRVACNQQRGGSNDCGVYVVKAIELLVDRVGTGDKQACSRQIILDDANTGWEDRTRKMLTIKEKKSQRTIRAILEPVELKLREHQEGLDRALWHLQHAGAILLSFNHLDPEASLTHDQNQRCPSPSPASEEGCGMTVIPVPRGHKVILQR